MGFFTEMFSPRKNPNLELTRAPNQIQPVLQTPSVDWGPKPTGYYPDRNPEQMGYVHNDYPVMEPNGSAGGAVVPTTAVNAEKVDQHAYTQISGTWTPLTHEQGNGRPTGRHDPQTDGPAKPDQRLLSLWYYRGSGNQRTSYMDVPDGRTFPRTGSQDGSSTSWYQSVSAVLTPYNVDPSTYDPKHPYDSTEMPDSLTAIPAGPNHGWSAIPVASGPVIARNQDKVRRHQKNVGQNRLAMSTYAGQTYSQSTAHVANPPGAGVSAATPMSSAPGGIA